VRGNLLAQYLRVKAQHQAAILLFRLGDFYEMFFEDAKIASAVCDLTLTARNRGEPDEVPLCGFPAHAAQPYIARLLAAGHAVAISEQVETKGRGLMEREVVRVITPGTILEEENLEPGAPSLLVSLVADGDERFALGVVDFATGTFRIAEIPGWAATREELGRLAPRELLLDPDLPAAVTAWCGPPRPWATAAMPEPVAVDAPLPPLAARAAGGVLAYLDAVYRRRPTHLRPPELYALAGFLGLDASTCRNLELLQTLGGERRGSLLWVLDATRTPMGARRLREWVLYPLLDAAAIGERLDGVEPLADAGPALLQRLASALEPLPEVAQLVRSTLVDAPPPHTRLPGYIRAGHHPEIDALREASSDGKGWLARFEATERERTGIPSLKVRYNKVFGYYVEVTKPNLPLVPPDYERKQTLVSAERFVTPALKEHEARVLGAEERLRALEQHCFQELLDAVARHHPTLVRTADALAALDVVAGLAETAHRRGWVRARITKDPVIRVRGGRHPVVEAVGPEPFVPNDVMLDAEAEQLLLITGPNMGGKSTYLRQVALLTLLAQMGSFVPATEAEIGLADRIFTRVGASDNLVGGESTFMVEMRETAQILAGLTPRSLVVLDEIGRGTSTFDGISIAWAVAEHLHDAPERPRTLFATHYHELTALAAERPRIRNLSVAVAEWNGQVVFLRQIVQGPAPRSYGVEVAALAGVPPALVARAREILARLEAGQDAGREPRARRLGTPTAQLSLFSPPDSRLRQELAAIEPERLSPLEALVTLTKIVERARQPP
jgi:DNA mismatch repair protein MutS